MSIDRQEGSPFNPTLEVSTKLAEQAEKARKKAVEKRGREELDYLRRNAKPALSAVSHDIKQAGRHPFIAIKMAYDGSQRMTLQWDGVSYPDYYAKSPGFTLWTGKRVDVSVLRDEEGAIVGVCVNSSDDESIGRRKPSTAIVTSQITEFLPGAVNQEATQANVVEVDNPSFFNRRKFLEK